MLQAPIVAGDGFEPSPIRLLVLGLGAGVQSTTLVLVAAHALSGQARLRYFCPPGENLAR